MSREEVGKPGEEHEDDPGFCLRHPLYVGLSLIRVQLLYRFKPQLRGRVRRRKHGLPGGVSSFGRHFRRGTTRTGSLVRVSSSGLASWRSSAVKAAMTSGASNALLRRPMFTCRRIPASTRRWIAAAAGL